MSYEHETGWKGDIGVAKATADMISQGFMVLAPVAATSPFDLVVYRDGRFSKVQVKYRTIKNGVIKTELRRSVISNGRCVHRAMEPDEVDVLCIYCPDTDRCYYVSTTEAPNGCSLRVEEAGVSLPGIRWAEKYARLEDALAWKSVRVKDVAVTKTA